jgi:hypothetical protein
MPAKTEKQERFMRAVAHSPSFSKKVGVPMSVGREFTKSGGGMPLKLESESEKRSSESDMSKRKAVSGMKKGGKVKKMAAGGMTASKMGAVKTAAPSRDGVAVKGKTKGKQIVMAGNKGMKSGGMAKKYC